MVPPGPATTDSDEADGPPPLAPPDVEPCRFREVLGRFVTGVAVATTRTPEGAPAGVTINSFASVSLDPPLVLFCLGRHTRTLPFFLAAKGFAITLLAADQRDVSQSFARTPFLWDGLGVEEWTTGAPILRDGVAALDCTLETVHEAGDHLILIGRVRRLASLREVPPLVFHRSDYAGLAADD